MPVAIVALWPPRVAVNVGRSAAAGEPARIHLALRYVVQRGERRGVALVVLRDALN